MELNWYYIAVAAVIALALVAYVVVQVLRLKKEITNDTADAAEGWIAKWVSIGVYAAEMMFGPGTGEKKLAYVIDLLTDLGIEVKDPERAMIEAAVFNLKTKTE